MKLKKVKVKQQRPRKMATPIKIRPKPITPIITPQPATP